MIEETGYDIFHIENPNSLIVLQSNTLGYGATGLFKRLRTEYPNAFEYYHDFCSCFNDRKHQPEAIGHTIGTLLDGSDETRICFAFAQQFITETKYEVDFNAWDTILNSIEKQVVANKNNTGILYELHFPNKIGYGMKPGEAEHVKQMIIDKFQDSSIKVVFHI